MFLHAADVDDETTATGGNVPVDAANYHSRNPVITMIFPGKFP
jgi:hypothetical protein